MLRQNKGVVLLFVLGTILITVILANVVLRIMLNQSRLTHHQISRIRAYYADLAGMNLALEKIRLGDWGPAAVVRYGCINGPVDSGVSCDFTNSDSDIPYNVQIALYPTGSGLNGAGSKLDIKTNYTYQ